MGITNSPGFDLATHVGASFFCSIVSSRKGAFENDPNVLVAGCGNGSEAVFIHDCLRANVTAVDIWLQRGRDLPTRKRLTFRECDITYLPFAPGVFDVVFYHHVIEHVADPAASLREIARVLRPKGGLFVGTPNRHRLIGNVGAYGQSVGYKLWQNLRDWRMRLQGRFRNELGAHAGFSQKELDSLLSPHFGHRSWITDEYLLFKYSQGVRRWVARAATAGPLRDVCVPSIYAWCRKP